MIWDFKFSFLFNPELYSSSLLNHVVLQEIVNVSEGIPSYVGDKGNTFHQLFSNFETKQRHDA